MVSCGVNRTRKGASLQELVWGRAQPQLSSQWGRCRPGQGWKLVCRESHLGVSDRPLAQSKFCGTGTFPDGPITRAGPSATGHSPPLQSLRAGRPCPWRVQSGQTVYRPRAVRRSTLLSLTVPRIAHCPPKKTRRTPAHQLWIDRQMPLIQSASRTSQPAAQRPRRQ